MLAKDYVSVINIAVLRFACCLCQSYAKHRETLQILQINVIIRLKSLEEFATHLCVGWLFVLQRPPWAKLCIAAPPDQVIRYFHVANG